MSGWLSPSPYGWHDWDITPACKQTLIYHQMHDRNAGTGSVIDTARRARDYQAELERERENVDCLARQICNLYSDLENAVSEKLQYQAKLAEIERIIDEYSHRYSEGSQGRVAIESVSLKINGG